MRRAVLNSAILSLSLLGYSAALIAQTCLPGTLRVYVKDSQEAPIFDVQVQVASGGQKLASATTGSQGTADFANVPCGSWSVNAAKASFEENTGNIQIQSAAAAELTIVLNPQIVRSSVNVEEKAPPVQQNASVQTEVHPSDVRTLPTNPATVGETLPLVPGIIRSPDGQLILDGSGEQRSSLVVNQSDQTDPATGQFGQTVPIDAIDTVNVLNTPFLAQYGRFTQTVIAIDTKRGGEKWHYDLNDPFPDFRVRSYHLVGIRNETPRFALGGPLIPNRLYFNSAIVYIIDKIPSRTLGFPNNESKHESINSFSQLDYIASAKQIITATVHVSPQHINFVNPDYFNPEPTTPTYAQHNYIGDRRGSLRIVERNAGQFGFVPAIQRIHRCAGPGRHGPDARRQPGKLFRYSKPRGQACGMAGNLVPCPAQSFRNTPVQSWQLVDLLE